MRDGVSLCDGVCVGLAQHVAVGFCVCLRHRERVALPDDHGERQLVRHGVCVWIGERIWLRVCVCIAVSERYAERHAFAVVPRHAVYVCVRHAVAERMRVCVFDGDGQRVAEWLCVGVGVAFSFTNGARARLAERLAQRLAERLRFRLNLGNGLALAVAKSFGQRLCVGHDLRVWLWLRLAERDAQRLEF